MVGTGHFTLKQLPPSRAYGQTYAFENSQGKEKSFLPGEVLFDFANDDTDDRNLSGHQVRGAGDKHLNTPPSQCLATELLDRSVGRGVHSV